MTSTILIIVMSLHIKTFCSFVAELDLSDNHLSTLPDELSNLTLLVEFNLSQNLFELLPSVLLNLPSLRKIDISHNNIEHVNIDDLCSIVNLESLDLQNNPLDDGTKEQFTSSPLGKITISFSY